MKKLIVIFVVFLLPLWAYPHPGKTDKYDGHQCLKGCEEWKLYYKEYHLHDKDRRPIRISRKQDFAPPQIETVSSDTPFPVQTQPAQSAPTITVYRYITTVNEESSFPFNPLLWVLLVLLLLLLIMQRKKRREPGP